MNERKTFLCIGLLPLLACSLLLLAITYAMESRDIEAKVKASAESALKDPKFSWVSAETHNKGRQVLLIGAAPSEEAIAEAKGLVAKASGVLNVTHTGEITEQPVLIDSVLTFDIDGESLTVKGEVANQDEVESIVSQIRKALPAYRINNQLTVGKNLKAANELHFLKGLLASEQPSKFSVELRDKELTLDGYVPSKSALTIANNKLKDLFPGNVTNNLVVNRAFCDTIVSQVQARGKINFATGKAIIDQTSYQLLDDMVAAVDRCPETVYEVGGHTDNTGNYDANIALSEERANAVARYLISAGLPAAQFKVKGYGPDRPIADNETEAGRGQNRRIEFTAYK